MRPFSTRQLFAAMLLASVVLGLFSAHPLLSAATLRSRLDPRVVHPARFEILSPSKRDSIVTVAWALIGEPYELGGTSVQRGFDCSGLVTFVLSKVQLKLPRTAKQQALVGAPIGRDGLLPGDLLTFGAGTRVSHVGIYVGDGKFVHASSIAGRVIVSRLDRPPSRLIRPLSGARRVLAVADSLAQRGGG
jgi:cell wall-associated NlpC family hydrolase